MIKIILLSLCLLVVSGFYFVLISRNQDKAVYAYRVTDLDNDGQEEKILFLSPEVNLSDGITDVYINGSKSPALTLKGYFIDSKAFDLKKGMRILEIEVISGKSINSTVYKYQDKNLIRIPISTEKQPGYIGIVTRNFPEFRDVDGDGVLEIIAYYRHFPPEKRKTVEVYRFDGERFNKQKEYEEITPELYF